MNPSYRVSLDCLASAAQPPNGWLAGRHLSWQASGDAAELLAAIEGELVPILRARLEPS